MTDFKPVKDYVVSDLDSADTSIKIGDTVRSYDFEHRSDCFVDGEVTALKTMEGCERYEIKPTRRVWGDAEYPEASFPPAFYPPVNGTCYAGRNGFTNFVRKL